MTLFELGVEDLREHLLSRKTSVQEVVASYLQRIEAKNPKLNAVVWVDSEGAGKRAAMLDALAETDKRNLPLFGLPLTIKENIEIADAECTIGIESRRGTKSRVSGVMVQMLTDLGAVIVGKTNVPQSLLSMETVNYIWGTTNNPWNVERTCGGSSGGEAVALASKMSLIGLGGDVGGSIRTPALFCGVAGLKPTLHRWSNRGMLGLLAGQEFTRAQIGPMARSAADLTYYFESVNPERLGPLDPEVPPVRPGRAADVQLKGLRVGYTPDDGYLTPAPSIRRALAQARDALESQGVVFVPIQPVSAAEQYPLIVAALTSDGMEVISEAIGDDQMIVPLRTNSRLARLPRLVLSQMAKVARLTGDKRLADILEQGGKKSVREFWNLCARRTYLQREEMDHWNQHRIDAVLTAGTLTAAPPHEAAADFTVATLYHMRYNVLNLPAGVVPVTTVNASDPRAEHPKRDRFDRKTVQIESQSIGLPVGVQVVSRPYREDVVLALLAAIESEARTHSDFPDLQKIKV